MTIDAQQAVFRLPSQVFSPTTRKELQLVQVSFAASVGRRFREQEHAIILLWSGITFDVARKVASFTAKADRAYQLAKVAEGTVQSIGHLSKRAASVSEVKFVLGKVNHLVWELLPTVLKVMPSRHEGKPVLTIQTKNLSRNLDEESCAQAASGSFNQADRSENSTNLDET